MKSCNHKQSPWGYVKIEALAIVVVSTEHFWLIQGWQHSFKHLPCLIKVMGFWYDPGCCSFSDCNRNNTGECSPQTTCGSSIGHSWFSGPCRCILVMVNSCTFNVPKIFCIRASLTTIIWTHLWRENIKFGGASCHPFRFPRVASDLLAVLGGSLSWIYVARWQGRPKIAIRMDG